MHSSAFFEWLRGSCGTCDPLRYVQLSPDQAIACAFLKEYGGYCSNNKEKRDAPRLQEIVYGPTARNALRQPSVSRIEFYFLGRVHRAKELSIEMYSGWLDVDTRQVHFDAPRAVSRESSS